MLLIVNLVEFDLIILGQLYLKPLMNGLWSTKLNNCMWAVLMEALQHRVTGATSAKIVRGTLEDKSLDLCLRDSQYRV